MARRFLFEHKHQPIIAPHQFVKRILSCVLLSLVILVLVVSLGAIAYHVIEKQIWIDALLNAVMVMSGLGLQSEIKTYDGKVFTLFYALFSAIAFYTILGILFTPLLHRFLHHFHLEGRNQD